MAFWASRDSDGEFKLWRKKPVEYKHSTDIIWVESRAYSKDEITIDYDISHKILPEGLKNGECVKIKFNRCERIK